MNKVFYIANWKSHKSKNEAMMFFEYLKNKITQIDLSDKEIIIAPPFTLLAKCRYLIDEHDLPIMLAAQNVSAYPSGAYTGEINAKQVKEFAEYVIIGHSERKKYLHETETDIENKIREAHEAGLQVIQCIQDENSLIHHGANIVAYEPPSAIGSGNPDDPQHVENVFKSIKEHHANVSLLYGGSVNPETIGEFKEVENLKGFLIGSASLEADSFISLLS